MFGRKNRAPVVAGEVPNPWGFGTVSVDADGNPLGVVTVGSMGIDDDADADVVGELAFRDTLLAELDVADDEEVDAGRLTVQCTLSPDGRRVAVFLAGDQVGYLGDTEEAEWGPRLRDWFANGVVKVNCSGVILWDQRLGDPRDDDSIPVGLRLDLQDQR